MSAVVRQLAECDEVANTPPGVSLRTTLDQAAGCPRLVQRQLRILAGSSTVVTCGGAGELWYVASGDGSFAHGGDTRSLTQGTALLVPPGDHLVAARAGILEIAAVVLPCDDEPPVSAVIEAHLDTSPEERTGDRSFRVLIGARQDVSRATQFVGTIPPGRAPLHEHTYDEVVMVLEGSGVLHADSGTWELTRGTSIYLPPGTKHCLEHSGEVTLRVLGVFCPGGTPAAKREHVS